MRRWGIIVTAHYVVILTVLLVPGAIFVAIGEYPEDLLSTYDEVLPALFSLDGILEGTWLIWLTVAVLAISQALLLFLAVDNSFERLRPRRRVTLSVTTTAFAAGLLMLAALWSIGVAIWADAAAEMLWLTVGAPLVSWGFWGVIFFLYRERISARLDRTLNWLLGGSVLQLLIAVPCHVIVRNRGDCCAPGVSAFGIATGAAVMLMAFGPSVLFLYQRRLRKYGLEATPRVVSPRRIVSVTLGSLAAAGVALAIVSPVDDDWLFSPEISAQRSPAAAALVVDVASEFGMTAEAQNEEVTLLLCNDESIARIQASTARDDGTERWVIAVRADQVEVADALTTALADYANEPFAVFPPATVNRWRAWIRHGAFLSGRCDSR